MTPDFPSFASFFHGSSARPGPAARSLHQLESLLGPWIGPGLLAPTDEGAFSRQRRWPLRLVFWSFLWQVAHPGSACREAVRQARAFCLRSGQPVPADEANVYVTARAALPVERLQQIHDSVVREADQAVAARDLWHGHRVLVVDGTTVSAPDTPANQRAYPQQRGQKPGCGFPILRLTGLLSLATGMVVSWATGPWRSHELGLFQKLWDCLRPGDVLLGDRGFCSWGVLAQCRRRQVHAVLRVRGTVRADLRRGRRTGPGERQLLWTKPPRCSRTVSTAEWEKLPDALEVRVVSSRLARRGFRTKRVTVVTTLLDAAAYPAEDLGRLYQRRWEMELCLRSLKTTLGMDVLSCLRPENLEVELRLHLLLHNLVRRLMLEAARQHRVPPERLSFAGSLGAARCFATAMEAARSVRQRQKLWAELLRSIAEDPVPQRPGRSEPRAVKRRPKPYPRLMRHRHSRRASPILSPASNSHTPGKSRP